MTLTSQMVSAGATRSADEGDQAMKRMQFMLKQLTAEKAELENKVTDMEKEVKDLKKDLKAAETTIEDRNAEINSKNNNIAGLNGVVAKQSAKIEKREGQLRQVIEKYKDAQILINQLNNDVANLQDDIADRDDTIALQEEKNLKMYEANAELMELYENKGAWDSALQAEGFTGIKQVQIENILQEYRFKLQDSKISQAEKSDSE